MNGQQPWHGLQGKNPGFWQILINASTLPSDIVLNYTTVFGVVSSRVVITNLLRQKCLSRCPFCSSIRFHHPDNLICPLLFHRRSFTRGWVFTASAWTHAASAQTHGPTVQTQALSAQMREKISKKIKFYVHADAGPIRADEKIYLINKIKSVCTNSWVRLCGCTYALTFFLGGWKCEWEVDVTCGRKRFFDQISNFQIWKYNDLIWAFFLFMDRHLI